MRKLIFIFISCLSLMECKKEADFFAEPYDTIFPEPYLPVYPGSYWIYNQGTVEYKTSDSYIIHSFVYNVGSEFFESKPTYIPFWNGKPVYKYSAPLGWSANESVASDLPKHYSIMINYLSTIKGFSWIDSSFSSRYQGSHAWKSSVIAVDTTIQSGVNFYDSVIVVDHEDHGKYFYAKNIGLVRVDNPLDSVIMTLDTFYINH